MSLPPPAPAPQPAPKKGFSPLAWVAVGCGCLILMAGAVTVVGGFFLAKAGQKVVDSVEKNPVRAAGEVLTRFNPDLEIVSSDEDAGTVTVRNTRKDTTITVNLEDLKEGRLSFETEDSNGQRESVDIRADGEGVVVKDGDGESTLEIGPPANQELPNWVPLFPGSQPEGAFRMTEDQTTSGTFHLQAAASTQEVLAFYRQELESAGFEVKTTQVSSEEGLGGVLSATHDSSGRQLSTTISDSDGESRVIVQYSENKH